VCVCACGYDCINEAKLCSHASPMCCILLTLLNQAFACLAFRQGRRGVRGQPCGSICGAGGAGREVYQFTCFTEFTCFTGKKVQTLTQLNTCREGGAYPHPTAAAGAHFTCFTSKKVRILTQLPQWAKRVSLGGGGGGGGERGGGGGRRKEDIQMLKFNSDGVSVEVGRLTPAPTRVCGEHQGAQELKASTSRNNHAVLANPHSENERAAGGAGSSFKALSTLRGPSAASPSLGASASEYKRLPAWAQTPMPSQTRERQRQQSTQQTPQPQRLPLWAQTSSAQRGQVLCFTCVTSTKVQIFTPEGQLPFLVARQLLADRQDVC
jgi:hypothetical protein